MVRPKIRSARSSSVQVVTFSHALEQPAVCYAYEQAFQGGAEVAVADIDGDGIDQLITGAGPGGGPHVKVFRAAGGTVVETGGFYAYEQAFHGGVHVASLEADHSGGDGFSRSSRRGSWRACGAPC